MNLYIMGLVNHYRIQCSLYIPILIIDCEAREIMYLVASVRPSVHLSVCLFVYALTAELFDL